jgi:hypothetical protein
MPNPDPTAASTKYEIVRFDTPKTGANRKVVLDADEIEALAKGTLLTSVTTKCAELMAAPKA